MDDTQSSKGVFTNRNIIDMFVYTTMLTTDEVTDMLKISRIYFYVTIKPHLSTIHLKKDDFIELINDPYFMSLSTEQKEFIYAAKRKNRQSFFSSVQLAIFISENFLIDNSAISFDMATYLLQLNWYCEKEIADLAGHDFSMQTRRYLNKSSNPYLKIKHVNSNGKMLVRYIKV